MASYRESDTKFLILLFTQLNKANQDSNIVMVPIWTTIGEHNHSTGWPEVTIMVMVFNKSNEKRFILKLVNEGHPRLYFYRTCKLLIISPDATAVLCHSGTISDKVETEVPPFVDVIDFYLHERSKEVFCDGGDEILQKRIEYDLLSDFLTVEEAKKCVEILTDCAFSYLDSIEDSPIEDSPIDEVFYKKSSFRSSNGYLHLEHSC